MTTMSNSTNPDFDPAVEPLAYTEATITIDLRISEAAYWPAEVMSEVFDDPSDDWKDDISFAVTSIRKFLNSLVGMEIKEITATNMKKSLYPSYPLPSDEEMDAYTADFRSAIDAPDEIEEWKTVKYETAASLAAVADALYEALSVCRPWIGDFQQGDDALALYRSVLKGRLL